MKNRLLLGLLLPICIAAKGQNATKTGKSLSTENVLRSAANPNIRKINIVVDSIHKTIILPVGGTGHHLRSFDPQFIIFPGTTLSPKGPQDFSMGAVSYSIGLPGRAKDTYKVSVVENHNPVLNGYYADPEILYAHKTGKYYIYPTSDGFDHWSGDYFKTFSSKDLVNWKDEGVILDLPRDVKWAKKNAWAPCIIEKKIGNTYKYFYYFTAASKIGVAVSNEPTGPFVDSGQALIPALPEGITRGQQIDPDVFCDPKTGKYYLYWGNSYMAVAELNEDMVSLKAGTTKILTPHDHFNEGTYVIYRKGIYYFMWSENDTRSEKYSVHYGTSDSPAGKISVPENNTVIIGEKSAGIYATGHNSVIQVPGKDEWYIVYHRFNYPAGITTGEDAGYHREVCIDPLTFGKDGQINRVIPTHSGIKPLK